MEVGRKTKPGERHLFDYCRGNAYCKKIDYKFQCIICGEDHIKANTRISYFINGEYYGSAHPACAGRKNGENVYY